MLAFPYVIDGKEIANHLEWLEANKDFLTITLTANKAILFKNFSLVGQKELESVIKILFPPEMMLDYSGGTSPREKVSDFVYTSTKMPFFLKIPLHSEMAYRKKFPKKIMFFCQEAPLVKGETPIVDLDKVEADIPLSVQNKLKSEGIIYYRKLKNKTPLRKFLSKFNPMIETATWQHVFKTENRFEVEEYCRKHSYECEWSPNGSVILKTHLPAFLNNKWFNSFHFFQIHPGIWGRGIAFLYKSLMTILGEKDLSATTGTGHKLTQEEITSIIQAYDKNVVSFKWEKGDLLLLDNERTAHGRNPYFGRRKILVSLAEEGEY